MVAGPALLASAVEAGSSSQGSPVSSGGTTVRPTALPARPGTVNSPVSFVVASTAGTPPAPTETWAPASGSPWASVILPVSAGDAGTTRLHFDSVSRSASAIGARPDSCGTTSTS